MFGFSKYKNLPLGDITENCKYGDFAPCLDEWTDIGRRWESTEFDQELRFGLDLGRFGNF